MPKVDLQQKIEVSPGRFKALGECDRDDLASAAALCRNRAEDLKMRAQVVEAMIERRGD